MKKRLLVVDDNKGMVEMIKEYFCDNSKIEVIYTAKDGLEAMDIISEHESEIDVILLDLIMPRKDGMHVLDSLKRKNYDIPRHIIVMTSYNEPETTKNVSEYGVRYFALKPFDLADLEDKIMKVTKPIETNGKIYDLEGKNIEKSVTKLLHELGIPSNIKGYQYIRSAIMMVYTDPSLIGGITKELYPEIASQFKTSTSRVERAIRHAIEVSWNRGDYDLMEEIFGHSVDIDRSKPTNSEFIVTIADKLRLEMIEVS